MKTIIKTFDELTINELYQLLSLRSEIFVVEQNCVYNDLDGKDDKSYHVMIMEGEQIVAYERIVKAGFSYKETSLGRVVVAKEFRGKGIARTLLLAGIDFIKNELKEDMIRISAQTYLLDFYSSLGFKATSEEYLEDGIPHVEMVRHSQSSLR